MQASANRGVWDVQYNDGDESTDLCHSCVRPFIPYTIMERIDVLVGPDHYTSCQVVATHRLSKSNNTATDFVYDVQLDGDSGKVISRVPTNRLRRSGGDDDSLSEIPPNESVMAMFKDDYGNDVNYFPGKIVRYNPERNSYDIQFDDGDTAFNVQRRDIRLKK
jgi:hypothetical protein